jgi:hypothetical protein
MVNKQIGSGSCMSRSNNKIHALEMRIHDIPLQITAKAKEEEEKGTITYDPVVNFLDDDTDEKVIKKLVQDVFKRTLEQGTIRENVQHNTASRLLDMLNPDLLGIISEGLSHLDVASLRQTTSSMRAMLSDSAKMTEKAIGNRKKTISDALVSYFKGEEDHIKQYISPKFEDNWTDTIDIIVLHEKTFHIFHSSYSLTMLDKDFADLKLKTWEANDVYWYSYVQMDENNIENSKIKTIEQGCKELADGIANHIARDKCFAELAHNDVDSKVFCFGSLFDCIPTGSHIDKTVNMMNIDAHFSGKNIISTAACWEQAKIKFGASFDVFEYLKQVYEKLVADLDKLDSGYPDWKSVKDNLQPSLSVIITMITMAKRLRRAKKTSAPGGLVGSGGFKKTGKTVKVGSHVRQEYKMGRRSFVKCKGKMMPLVEARRCI